MALKLDSIDPQEAWKPAPKKRWDLKWAAHLYRRAAFAAPAKGTVDGSSSWERLQSAVEQGRDKCVDQLLAGGPGQKDFDNLLDDMGRRIAASDELEKLQGWWLYRMLHTPHPLRERLTLFWHNHFATSAAKVTQLPLMLRQNQLLREHALGGFRPLLLQISRDPAMLIWLDSNSNTKGKPNENYAREVMELFSLGVGNYTEQDIQEAARAFTGWRAEGGEYAFEKSLHDFGSKTVLGRTGEWNGDDIVRILLQQDVAAPFLVRKLFREFISESETPSDELIEPLADELRKSDYDISTCLGTMLRSRLFFSQHAYRQRVKSPVEYVVGMLKTFDANVPLEDLARSMEDLGQSLFAPPNVKGWDGGAAWLNSATLLARDNLAWRLVGGQDASFQQKVNPLALVKRYGGDTRTKQVDFLLQLTVQGDVSDAAEKKLVVFAENGPEPYEIESDSLPTPEVLESVGIRELTHSILLMPEYQLS
jgi:uncharacterized protein (DUF1800 family)